MACYRQLSVNWRRYGFAFQLAGNRRAGILLLGTVLILIFAIFLPKQLRGDVLRRVGRWFQGF